MTDVRSILPVGECVTSQRRRGDEVERRLDVLREIANAWPAFGSRMTSPGRVVPAGIAGSVPNFIALGSAGIRHALRRQVQNDLGEVDVQRVGGDLVADALDLDVDEAGVAATAAAPPARGSSAGPARRPPSPCRPIIPFSFCSHVSGVVEQSGVGSGGVGLQQSDHGRRAARHLARDAGGHVERRRIEAVHPRRQVEARLGDVRGDQPTCADTEGQERSED